MINYKWIDCGPYGWHTSTITIPYKGSKVRGKKISNLTEEEVDALRKAEKELSDAYLRVRELVGAWNTNHGGENRFEVTENAIKALKKEVDQLKKENEKLRKILKLNKA